MELLTSVFRQLLSMSLTALPVMAVVLAARFFLRKAPKKFSYLLWAVVAFRLVCPVSVASPVGLVEPGELARRVETAGQAGDVVPGRTLWEAAEDDAPAPEPAGESVPSGGEAPAAAAPESVSQPAAESGLLSAAAVIWLLGMAAVLAYGAAGALRLRRQVAAAVRREGNVWECGGIPTPFVLGLFRPRIYIPFRLTEEERRYVLAHERYHIRCLDHWAKLLGYLILAAYWWNPAVWLCWTLCCRDMEMRCDEAVLARLGDGVKAGYSLSLVTFAQDRRTPAALAFGEHDAARRVKNVLNWKQARPAAVFLAVAAVALVAAVCGTDARRGSWLKAEHTGSTVSFTCEMREPIRSWAIYQDVYENGKLTSSRPCAFDSFQDDGGASPREFSGSLTVNPVYAEEGGFEGSLDICLQCVGSFTWTCDILPRDHYTGMASVLGDGANAPGKLENEGSAALYTVLLSTAPSGAIRAGGTAEDLLANDTVVQFRFVTSTLPLKELAAQAAREPNAGYAGQNFQTVLETLPAGSFCALLPLDGGPLLLVTDGIYAFAEDGGTVDASFSCRRVYRAAEGGVQELEGLSGGGTAYPIRWDGGSLYTAGAHHVERYALTGDGAAFAMVESAAETFDGDGGISYLYTSPETGAVGVPDERFLRELRAAYARAEPARFVPAAGLQALLDRLDGEGQSPARLEPFTDILGYDGFISVEYADQIAWSNRTYYAVTGEEAFPIAESFGWGDPQDYAVDLDGDGQEELVCDVTYGADGARRVSIYQRRGDEIWRSWVTADGLPGYERDGVGSSYEEYDPVENVFRIHYRKAGQEDFAVAEIRGMAAQLEAWYPYP